MRTDRGATGRQRKGRELKRAITHSLCNENQFSRVKCFPPPSLRRVSEVDHCLLESYAGLASRHLERRKAAHVMVGNCSSSLAKAFSTVGDGSEDEDEEEEDEEDGPPRESTIGIRPAVDEIPVEEVSEDLRFRFGKDIAAKSISPFELQREECELHVRTISYALHFLLFSRKPTFPRYEIVACAGEAHF